VNNLGYLYVLANSAMPGLVKVGKTTRNPDERANELSGVTGLPTPFIVVYEQLFSDCSSAEEFVHTYLAQKGFRVADNREFFSAPVNDVVRAIALAPGAIDAATASDSTNDDEDNLLNQSDGNDELGDLSLSSYTPPPQQYPWSDLIEEADAHYLGLGDCIQDYTEAMRLYKQAAKLGCATAYAPIAIMYEDGEGVREDKAKAIEYYKEGAKKGDVYCYWKMGFMFYTEAATPGLCNNAQADQSRANADKCFYLFIKNYSTKNALVSSTQIGQSIMLFNLASLINYENKYGIPFPEPLKGFLLEHTDTAIEKLKEDIERQRGFGRIKLSEVFTDAIRVLEDKKASRST
jgi:hypothetical protein